MSRALGVKEKGTYSETISTNAYTQTYTRVITFIHTHTGKNPEIGNFFIDYGTKFITSDKYNNVMEQCHFIFFRTRNIMQQFVYIETKSGDIYD